MDPETSTLEDLYAAHFTGLVRLATLLLRDQGEAEQVVQDAFLDLHQRWSRLREPDKAVGYLHTSVVNRARSVLRHRKVVAQRAQQEESPTHAPGADLEVDVRARRDVVLKALAELPDRQREVLVLRYYRDLSEAQIAQALGISAGSVKTHASRGAAALRATLEDQA